MPSVDQKSKVNLKLVSLVKLAETVYKRKFKVPPVSYDLKGTVAGTATYKTWSIQLNPILFDENEKEFLDQVVGHEFAHLLAVALYGPAITHHGKEWKSVMAAMGLRVEVKHRFNVENTLRTSKIFKYKCNCKEHLFTLRRHNSILKKKFVKIFCNVCKGSVEYTGAFKEKGVWQSEKLLTQNKPTLLSKIILPGESGRAYPVKVETEYATESQLKLLKELVSRHVVPFVPFKGLTKEKAREIISQALKKR